MNENQTLQLLKAATDEWHQRTERLGYGSQLKAGMFTDDMYIDLIQKNHFIYHQLETQFEASPLFQTPDFHQFYKARRTDLKNDLALTPTSTSSFPMPDQFVLTVYAHGIGLLYVLEGANLGRRLIHKLFKKQVLFNAEAYEPFHFYGRVDAANRWKTFANLVKSYVSTPQQQQLAKETAIATFQFFHQVYRK